MLEVRCKEHLETVREFARSIGAQKELQDALDYLDGYAYHDDPKREHTRCDLYKDFAPHSFRLCM